MGGDKEPQRYRALPDGKNEIFKWGKGANGENFRVQRVSGYETDHRPRSLSSRSAEEEDVPGGGGTPQGANGVS